MNKEYKIFSKGFNKILDLVEVYNEDFYAEYKAIIDTINDTVLSAVKECEDFATGNGEYDVDFMRLVNEVSLDYTRKKNYMRSDICIHRIFEEDLFKNGLKQKIFSIDQRNTKVKLPHVQFYYEEKNGKYDFVGINHDVHYQIDLEMLDGEFYIVSSVFNGIKTHRIKVPISFDELLNYVEKEDEFEEDLEVEFDSDFDL